MKIALFSDIHANYSALMAVLSDIDSRNPDAIYCLGDLVGYAPFPNEVIQEIQKRKIPTIAGNYDEGIGLGLLITAVVLTKQKKKKGQWGHFQLPLPIKLLVSAERKNT